MKEQQAIREWLRPRVAKLAGMEPDELDASRPLEELGIASVKFVALTGDLEDWLETRVDPAVFWEFANLEEVAAHLAESAGP